MTSFPDHYAALGIDPGADQEVITAAYRALAKKYHPDTGATAGTASPERFEEVQRAYEVLRDPETRRQYDAELLAATERELDEHLASRRRMLGTARRAEARSERGLGAIRPEPRPAAAAPRRAMSYLVPGLLLAAVLAIAAVFLLPGTPRPPVVADAGSQAPAEEPAPAAEAAQTPAPAPEPAPAPTPATAAGPAPAPAPEPAPAPVPAPASAPAPDSPPEAAPAPAPETADAAADQPVFGSSAQPEPAPDLAAPVPTPKPAVTAEAPADPPASPPPPAKEKRKKRAAKTVLVEPAPLPPGGPYRLVIFERPHGAQILAWNAGVFKSARRCTRVGVNTVQRRLNDFGPSARVWYECQPLNGPL